MIPSVITVFEDKLDPRDISDFEIDLKPYLEDTETAVSWQLFLLPEAEAAGLELGLGTYAATKTADIITLWLNVETPMQLDAMFYGGGLLLPFECEIVTSSVPPRRRQRTFGVRVVQQ
jgi:hypothetical protein